VFVSDGEEIGQRGIEVLCLFVKKKCRNTALHFHVNKNAETFLPFLGLIRSWDFFIDRK
jgi:hypothetical protein